MERIGRVAAICGRCMIVSDLDPRSPIESMELSAPDLLCRDGEVRLDVRITCRPFATPGLTAQVGFYSDKCAFMRLSFPPSAQLALCPGETVTTQVLARVGEDAQMHQEFLRGFAVAAAACLSRLCLAFPSGSRRTPRSSSVSWPRSGPGSSTTDSSRSTPRRCSRERCCSPVALSTPTAGTPSPPSFEVVEPPQTQRRTGQRLGLRYDLTVPLARYVAEHRDTLVFPLQHYPINKVWRAERPTLGHYREFYQCDIDVIGRDELDLRHDAEIACALNHAFDKIGIEGFRIRISHRRVLAALLAAHGIHDDRTREIVLIVDEGGRQPASKTVADLVAAGVQQDAARATGALLECSILTEARQLLSQHGAAPGWPR
jgi:Histidyl-tRNA synthetase